MATRYSLIRVSDPVDWRDYHEIRRRSLWDERGLAGYDENRPHERLPDHHALLLKFDARAIGTTRLDDLKDGSAIVRLVAIRADDRGKGHGRELSDRVDVYARQLGVTTLFVSAARSAEGFYLATGWKPTSTEPENSADDFITMMKSVAAEVWR